MKDVWIISGIISIMFTVTWFSIRNWIKNTNEKLEELIHEVAKLTNKTVSHYERINNVEKRIDKNCERLDDHSKRLRDIEIKIYT